MRFTIERDVSLAPYNTFGVDVRAACFVRVGRPEELGELLADPKERAEHVMLIDLERNDLGRICRGGSVQVDEYMTIETYATVHHIVSNVRGELRDGVTPGETIAAMFPGGTITGCPKVRCMELLAEVEGTPRDAYTGSMGYLGCDGSLDLNILIRTLAVGERGIEFRTGAGIVADSQPALEYEETISKAKSLLRAIEIAEKGARRAAQENPEIAEGINIIEGKVTYPGVADAFGLKYTPIEKVLGQKKRK